MEFEIVLLKNYTISINKTFFIDMQVVQAKSSQTSVFTCQSIIDG